MKKHLLNLLIIPVLCITCTAQVVLNNVYDNQNYDESAIDILKLKEGGYLLSGSTTTSGFHAALLIKIKANGDTVWQKSLDLTTYGENINQVIYAIDSNYIVTGSTRDTNASSAAFIMKVDTSGNIMWWNRYGGLGNEVGQDIKQTKDGGYIMSGWTSSNTFQPNPNMYEDGYVVKIDSLGNLEWQTQFGDSTANYFYTIDTTTDGGYVMAGRTFTIGTNGDMWMVKIDSLGNFQWEQNFGGPNIDFGKSVLQTLDGGYILSGSYQPAFLGDKNAYVVKTDSLGIFQWDKQYDFSAYSIIEGFKQNADSTFLFSGTVQYNFNEGFLMKISPQGDSLWSNTYRYYNTIENSIQHYFYNMELLDNGYVAMCGMAYDLYTPSGERGNVWIVIVDSLGCADTSCLPTGLEQSNPHPVQSYFEVYPNPANEFVNIIYKSGSCDKITLVIYNTMGNEIVKFQLYGENGSFELSTVSFAPGIYNCKFINSGFETVKKLVIVR